jgi:hypothetical protein
MMQRDSIVSYVSYVLVRWLIGACREDDMELPPPCESLFLSQGAFLFKL